MKPFSFLLFIWCCSCCFSQTKNEKEERISLSEFPEVTQNYFNSISHKLQSLKFFKETDGRKQSFEAKFKFKKLHYSVEFDTQGKLEDIEILIKKKYISKNGPKQIFEYFNSNFKKTRIIKIQKQFINKTHKTDEEFIKYIVDNPDEKNTHFEIIAEIKTKKKHELREFTFNRNGEFINSRLVTFSSYEHALY
ncbi:hypothetical protein GCM10023311_11590 [Flaviramulus aquimarinus]|uniref:Uncharacterized protein n=1 Tax=Flaviramulus aquimarinus TaxID=1170456 RepID=A0ABP9EYC2_9FLAO